MALRFLESFDHYTTVAQKWTSANGVILAGAARTGARGWRFGPGTGPYLTLDAQGTWVVGFALRLTGTPNTSQVVFTYDTAAPGTQGTLCLRADFTISLQRLVTEVVRSTRSLLMNTWYYVEFKHVIANAGGTLEVRVNGEVWATFAGDTQDTVNPTATRIWFTNWVGDCDLDDIYILDGTGAAPNNDYWGDTQVNCLMPDGNGFYQDWVMFGAATHWQTVNEVPPNEDTSYIEENLLNDIDTFTFQNLPVGTGTINGIQHMTRARDTVGAANVARLFREAGADDQGVDFAVAAAYAYYREIMETDPIALGAWTIANINAAEFGLVVR